MEPLNRRNLRRNERTPSQALAKLRWSGASGEARFARGLVLNCSPGGLCIQLSEPIQPHSYVSIDAPDLNRADWAGAGAVRHCTSRGPKYAVGFELSIGPQSQPGG